MPMPFSTFAESVDDAQLLQELAQTVADLLNTLDVYAGTGVLKLPHGVSLKDNMTVEEARHLVTRMKSRFPSLKI